MASRRYAAAFSRATIRLAAAALSVFVSSARVIAENSGWTERIAGQYEGELQSGSGFNPVTTHLKKPAGDTIEGFYILIEPTGRKVGGELTECAPLPAHELSCRWHDEYGSGRLVLTFDADLKSFQGRWSPSASQRWLPWSGTKR
jgi:hypothetical protein